MSVDNKSLGYNPEDVDSFAQGEAPANSEGTTPTTQQPDTQQPDIDPNAETATVDSPNVKGVSIPEPKIEEPKLTVPGRWDKGFENGLRESRLPIGTGISDYNRWAKENGKKPLDIFEMIPFMEGKDLSKSLGENEKDEKKLARQEKWERTGNFLAHLGSFVGALAGGPAQDIESGAELTKRQRALRDATINQRNAYNNTMLQLYYKQLADERAEQAALRTAAYQQAKMENDQKMTELRYRTEDRLEAQMWLNENYRDRKLTLDEAKQAALEDYRRGLLSQGAMKIAVSQMNAGTNRMRAEGYEDVVTTTENAVGTEKTVKKEHRPRGSSGGNGNQRIRINY